ncbi:MAG: hypothetical protein JOZ12_00470, partial [Sinobacteraceae bacterium]|nr:hypothetical protein [Nevskiaceae bacterium]
MSPGNSSRRLLLSVLALMWLGESSASPLEDYVLHCMGCHGSQAEGVPGRIPP